jgi:hypothetical protein
MVLPVAYSMLVILITLTNNGVPASTFNTIIVIVKNNEQFQ